MRDKDNMRKGVNEMNIDTMTGPELVVAYNEAAIKLGSNAVKRFTDRETGVRRTTKMVHAADEALGLIVVPLEDAIKKSVSKAPPVETTPISTSTKKTRKKRGMRFVFPLLGEPIRDCKVTCTTVSGDTRTLRHRCRDMLLTGATFGSVETLVVAFDEDVGKTSANVERRAYELVRIMHYYLGYRVSHTDGVIQLHTD